MKTMKIGVMLLALLLAAMAMVPMVSAGESANTASTVDVNKIELPHLQVDNSQEKVTVQKELSPVKGKSVYELPEGAIIKHSSEGVTQVFDSTGKQILSTDDSKSAKISTPNGLKPATYVHEVPSGSIISSDGNNTLFVTYNNELILTVIEENKLSNSPVPGLPDHWIEWGQIASAQNIGKFSANWNVPSQPTSSGGIIYLFNSVRSSNAIIQPVLAWGRDSVQSWRGAAWFVSGSTEFHSTLIDANVGDTINGEMTYNSGTWTISFTDTSRSNAVTSLGLSGYLSNTNVIPDVALEGYSTVGNSRLCGSTTFSNFVLTNPSGGSIAKSVTSGYGTYWINQYSLTGLSVVSSSPYNTVTLQTANS